MEAYLYLEAHIKAVESATDFTYRWCVNMGMDADEAARFTLAVDELLTDMILFAYPQVSGYIEIWYRYSLPQLEIIIQESGEPFDPERYPYSPEKALSEGDFQGAGLELVRNLTDHFLFLNRGREGKEFRLAKQLPELSYAEMQKFGKTTSEERDQDFEYSLEPVTSDDAEDIAKLIYRSYEYSYSKEALYFPKQNMLAIEQGKKFGVIGRTGDGRPVGYFTIIKEPDSQVGEVGEAVVSPPHRQKGLMKRMLNELITMSHDRGLMGLYGLALTVHIISQKVNQFFGFSTTALLVAVTLGSRHKNTATNNQQPKSLIVDFLPLTKKWKPTVYLPSRYHDILKKLYLQFNQTITINKPAVDLSSLKGETQMDLSFTYRNKTAKIVVNTIGNRFIPSAKSMLRSLNEINLNAIYFDIPLQQPSNEEAVEWLHRKGFILAGLLPLIHKEEDYMRMQKILVPVDIEQINTHSDMATNLKEYILEEFYELQQKQ